MPLMKNSLPPLTHVPLLAVFDRMLCLAPVTCRLTQAAIVKSLVPKLRVLGLATET